MALSHHDAARRNRSVADQRCRQQLTVTRQGRASYNWRDEFIIASNGDAQAAPMYTEAFGTMDASINYQITDNLQATFEDLNLNKAHINWRIK